jgi:hypothetical protein
LIGENREYVEKVRSAAHNVLAETPQAEEKENRKSKIIKYEEGKVLANKRKQLRRIRYRWRQLKQENLKKIYSRKCRMKNDEEKGTVRIK